MASQIFPKEIIHSTIEVHQCKYYTKSNVIYSIITLFIIGVMLIMPFIKVGVYTISNGYIKPDKERVTIQSITSGKVIFKRLKNNNIVNKGDTLLIVNNMALQHKLEKIKNQEIELKNFITDLNILLNNKAIHSLISQKFKQEILFFTQQKSELQTRFKKIKEDYYRSKKLFNKGVIAKTSLNESKLQYDLASSAIYKYKKEQFSKWQSQLVEYKDKLEELQSNKIQLQENKDLSVIQAPTSGTLLNVQGIEKGSFISSGFQLAEISPSSNLLVECYINPSDIGLLQNGDYVNFQITAFNYNQWGLATGKIINIANDIEVINNQPMFRVLCSLEQKYLTLKNGFKGYLKKGMSLNARFQLTERTLFDLLYDKVDNWMNPSTKM